MEKTRLDSLRDLWEMFQASPGPTTSFVDPVNRTLGFLDFESRGAFERGDWDWIYDNRGKEGERYVFVSMRAVKEGLSELEELRPGFGNMIKTPKAVRSCLKSSGSSVGRAKG